MAQELVLELSDDPRPAAATSVDATRVACVGCRAAVATFEAETAFVT